MFFSKTLNKKYCSMHCYTSSPEFKSRLLVRNKTSWHGQPLAPKPLCRQCGKEVRRRASKFCTPSCRRIYFADRFDRWVANPEKIALPQCYDEFLAREELPCLVEGCDWVGKHLACHVNFVHGISAADFKELAGFNSKTGLISSDLSDAFSQRTLDRIEEGTLNRGYQSPAGSSPQVKKEEPHALPQPRLEGKEHHAKALALMLAGGPQRPPRPCRVCENFVEQPVTGLKLYCSTQCRSSYYSRHNKAEVVCTYCGNKFMANRCQQLRSWKGQAVCCSTACRNRLNIVKALSARGISRCKELQSQDREECP
jgi:hypothetical protein